MYETGPNQKILANDPDDEKCWWNNIDNSQNGPGIGARCSRITENVKRFCPCVLPTYCLSQTEAIVPNEVKIVEWDTIDLRASSWINIPQNEDIWITKNGEINNGNNEMWGITRRTAKPSCDAGVYGIKRISIDGTDTCENPWNGSWGCDSNICNECNNNDCIWLMSWGGSHQTLLSDCVFQPPENNNPVPSPPTTLQLQCATCDVNNSDKPDKGFCKKLNDGFTTDLFMLLSENIAIGEDNCGITTGIKRNIFLMGENGSELYNKYSISGNNLRNILKIELGSNSVHFQNLRIKNGYTSENGGGVYISGGTTEVSFIECEFEGNRAEIGGAIYITTGANVRVQMSYFWANEGGAIYVNVATLTLINTAFINPYDQSDAGTTNGYACDGYSSTIYVIGGTVPDIETIECSDACIDYGCTSTDTGGCNCSSAEMANYFPDLNAQCAQCEAGYYCPNTDGKAFSKIRCPPGGYCVVGSSAPLNCRAVAGAVRPMSLPGSTSSDDCKSPIDGFSYNTGENTQGNYYGWVNVCPRGHKCNNGEKIPCPAGRYQDILGDVEGSDCKVCGYDKQKFESIGFYCPTGADAPKPVQSGFYSWPEDADITKRTHEKKCPFHLGVTCKGGRACPQGATCEIDGSYTINPPYWIATGIPIRSDTILAKCFNEEGCIYDKNTVTCDTKAGYTNGNGGVVCGVCINTLKNGTENFYRTPTKCEKCLSKYFLKRWMVVVFLLSYSFLLYQSANNKGRDSKSSAFWRIVISFYTVGASLQSGIVAKVPKQFQKVSKFLNGPMEIFAMLGNPSVAFDCLWPETPFTDRFIFTITLPYLYVLMVGVGLWILLKLKDVTKSSSLKKSSGKSMTVHDDLRYMPISQQIGGALVWLFYYMYFTILQSALSMLQCQQIETQTMGRNGEPINIRKTYLESNYEEICGEGKHGEIEISAYIFVTAYILGIPLVVFVITKAKSAILNEYKYKAMFGFLYQGFRIPWWGVVVFIRKIAVAVILVFFREPFLQSFYVLAVMIIALILQLQYRPFIDPLLNRLEALCIQTLVITQAATLLNNYLLGGPIDVMGFSREHKNPACEDFDCDGCYGNWYGLCCGCCNQHYDYSDGSAPNCSADGDHGDHGDHGVTLRSLTSHDMGHDMGPKDNYNKGNDDISSDNIRYELFIAIFLIFVTLDTFIFIIISAIKSKQHTIYYVKNKLNSWFWFDDTIAKRAEILAKMEHKRRKNYLQRHILRFDKLKNLENNMQEIASESCETILNKISKCTDVAAKQMEKVLQLQNDIYSNNIKGRHQIMTKAEKFAGAWVRIEERVYKGLALAEIKITETVLDFQKEIAEKITTNCFAIANCELWQAMETRDNFADELVNNFHKFNDNVHMPEHLITKMKAIIEDWAQIKDDLDSILINVNDKYVDIRERLDDLSSDVDSDENIHSGRRERNRIQRSQTSAYSLEELERQRRKQERNLRKKNAKADRHIPVAGFETLFLAYFKYKEYQQEQILRNQQRDRDLLSKRMTINNTQMGILADRRRLKKRQKKSIRRNKKLSNINKSKHKHHHHNHKHKHHLAPTTESGTREAIDAPDDAHNEYYKKKRRASISEVIKGTSKTDIQKEKTSPRPSRRRSIVEQTMSSPVSRISSKKNWQHLRRVTSDLDKNYTKLRPSRRRSIVEQTRSSPISRINSKKNWQNLRRVTSDLDKNCTKLRRISTNASIKINRKHSIASGIRRKSDFHHKDKGDIDIRRNSLDRRRKSRYYNKDGGSDRRDSVKGRRKSGYYNKGDGSDRRNSVITVEGRRKSGYYNNGNISDRRNSLSTQIKRFSIKENTNINKQIKRLSLKEKNNNHNKTMSNLRRKTSVGTSFNTGSTEKIKKHRTRASMHKSNKNDTIHHHKSEKRKRRIAVNENTAFGDVRNAIHKKKKNKAKGGQRSLLRSKRLKARNKYEKHQIFYKERRTKNKKLWKNAGKKALQQTSGPSICDDDEMSRRQSMLSDIQEQKYNRSGDNCSVNNYSELPPGTRHAI